MSPTRFLCAIPVAHNYPMSSPGALGVFHAGGAVVMAANPEPLACFDLIEKHHPDIDVTSARTGFTTDTDTE